MLLPNKLWLQKSNPKEQKIISNSYVKGKNKKTNITTTKLVTGYLQT
jgi:hypothetical protein